MSPIEFAHPTGIVSSLGVYGGKLEVPLESYVYGIGDKQILSTSASVEKSACAS